MEGRTGARLYVLEGSSRHNKKIEIEISISAVAFKRCFQQDLFKQLHKCLQLLTRIHKFCILYTGSSKSGVLAMIHSLNCDLYLLSKDFLTFVCSLMTFTSSSNIYGQLQKYGFCCLSSNVMCIVDSISSRLNPPVQLASRQVVVELSLQSLLQSCQAPLMQHLNTPSQSCSTH